MLSDDVLVLSGVRDSQNMISEPVLAGEVVITYSSFAYHILYTCSRSYILISCGGADLLW